MPDDFQSEKPGEMAALSDSPGPVEIPPQAAQNEDLVLSQLNHRDLQPAVIEQISQNTASMKSRKVRLAIAAHPDFASTDLSSLRDGYQPVLLSPERRGSDQSLRVAQLGMTETCSSHTWWPPAEQLPPQGGLMGTGTLINVNSGAMPQDMFMHQLQQIGSKVLPALQAHRVTRTLA